MNIHDAYGVQMHI